MDLTAVRRGACTYAEVPGSLLPVRYALSEYVSCDGVDPFGPPSATDEGCRRALAMLLLYPIATDRQPKRVPCVTYSLAGLNLVVALWWLLGTGEDGDVLRNLAFVPGQPTWYGVLTSMFMHGGWAHLLGNMLFLVLFGRNVEDAMGHVLFACSYLVCGVAAMVLHLAVTVAFAPDQLGVATVGASGAISGLLGLFVVRFFRTKITIWYLVLLLFIRMGTFQVSSVAGIGLWFAMQLFSGMLDIGSGAGGVAYWAHIGGFLFGVGYALLVGMEGEGSTEYDLGDAQRSASLGNWRNALTYAKQVLQREPDNAEAHFLAAQGFAQNQEPEDAEPHFLRALELSLGQSNNARAAQVYAALFAALPQAHLESRQHFAVAAVVARAGSYADAAAAYERIAKGAKNQHDWEAALVRLGQICLRFTGDLPRAKAAFQAVLRRNPDSELATHAR
ncbi:MAG: hypothetical protein COZ06_19490, partial [Armatimonadetes bacterium CG_4_10_14_3_um_filter_66_18]